MGPFLILYNLALLLGLVVLAPIWVGYLLAVPKARAGFAEKLGRLPAPLVQRLAQRPAGRKRLWLHAVSVGEFNAIKSLIPELEESFDVVISTTTRTGHDLAQRTFPHLPILYFPYDLRPVIHAVLGRVQPDLVVITETELWPNFIDITTRHRHCPLILINGRLSRHSHQGYQWIRPLIRTSLRQMTHLFIQSQADADRLQQLGKLEPERFTVVGNLKFDLIPTIDPTQQGILAHLLNIQPHDTVLTCASTHTGEDQELLETYLQLKKDFPELKLILAPRHPERAGEIRAILTAMAQPFSLRSQLHAENPNQQPIVVLDSIGELLTVYSFSTIAVMGGSFIERGGQNPLEPLSQRVPVIFGPHMDNFAQITQMILEAQAGYQVADRPQLINAVTELLTQPEIYDTIAENGQQLIENNRGAKTLINQAIHQYLL